MADAETRKQRKEAGLCQVCGAPLSPSRIGMYRCRECAVKNSISYAKWAEKPENQEYQRERRERWRAAGLCICCGKPAAPGCSTCKACQEKSKQRWDWSMEHGYCTKCGKQDAFTLAGRTMCSDCCDRRNQRRRELVEENPDRREQELSKKRELIVYRRENHLCTKCGKALPENSAYVTCQSCRSKANRKHQPAWHDPDFCSRCHREPPLEGFKLCRRCYEAACRSAEIARAARHPENDVVRKDINTLWKKIRRGADWCLTIQNHPE